MSKYPRNNLKRDALCGYRIGYRHISKRVKTKNVSIFDSEKKLTYMITLNTTLSKRTVTIIRGILRSNFLLTGHAQRSTK